MNHKQKNAEDASLRALLREGRTAPTLPPGFQNAVWQRLERTNAAPESRWLDALAGWLFRPRFAVACLAAVMLLGVTSGVAASARAERLDGQVRYVVSVDPFQKQP